MNVNHQTKILFNLDGVLLNAERDISSCLNLALETKNLPVIPIDSYKLCWGDAILSLIQTQSPCELSVAAQVAVAYQDICQSRGFVQTEVLHDTHSLLGELHNAGVRLESISSYIADPQGLLRKKILDKYFTDHHTTMGNRTTLLRAVLPKDDGMTTWLISDRVEDVKYAVELPNISSAAITWGNSDHWDLGILTPDLVVESAGELRTYFIEGKSFWRRN